MVVLGEAMVAMLFGRADGQRLTGTTPADTVYWGKDSAVFMREVFSFLTRSARNERS